MYLIKVNEGIGGTPASFMAEFENRKKDEIVSTVFMQLERVGGDSCRINVEIIVNMADFGSASYEKICFKISSKSDIVRLDCSTPWFKGLANPVVVALIGAYMPNNWFTSLPNY